MPEITLIPTKIPRHAPGPRDAWPGDGSAPDATGRSALQQEVPVRLVNEQPQLVEEQRVRLERR